MMTADEDELMATTTNEEVPLTAVERRKTSRPMLLSISENWSVFGIEWPLYFSRQFKACLTRRYTRRLRPLDSSTADWNGFGSAGWCSIPAVSPSRARAAGSWRSDSAGLGMMLEWSPADVDGRRPRRRGILLTAPRVPLRRGDRQTTLKWQRRSAACRAVGRRALSSVRYVNLASHRSSTQSPTPANRSADLRPGWSNVFAGNVTFYDLKVWVVNVMLLVKVPMLHGRETEAWNRPVFSGYGKWMDKFGMYCELTLFMTLESVNDRNTGRWENGACISLPSVFDL